MGSVVPREPSRGKLNKSLYTHYDIQGGHGGYTQIPYTEPYTPNKIHQKNPPVPIPYTHKKNLIDFLKNCVLGKPKIKSYSLNGRAEEGGGGG